MNFDDKEIMMRVRIIAGAVIAWFLLMMALSSCTTQKKAASYFDNHAFQGAAYCASRYPVDTFYKAGKEKIDSVITYLPGKTIPCPDSSKKDSVHCPDEKIVTINKSRIDTAGMISKAKYKQLEGENIALQNANADLKTKNAILQSENNKISDGRKQWRLCCLITWGILAAIGAGWIIAKTKVL